MQNETSKRQKQRRHWVGRGGFTSSQSRQSRTPSPIQNYWSQRFGSSEDRIPAKHSDAITKQLELWRRGKWDKRDYPDGLPVNFKPVDLVRQSTSGREHIKNDNAGSDADAKVTFDGNVDELKLRVQKYKQQNEYQRVLTFDSGDDDDDACDN